MTVNQLIHELRVAEAEGYGDWHLAVLHYESDGLYRVFIQSAEDIELHRPASPTPKARVLGRAQP